MKTNGPAPGLLLLAGVLCAAASLYFFPKSVVDDAYITFRYARNLALHGELNWNVGEDPVEGYTGVAMPVALAGWIRAGGDPVLAARAIGIIGLFATAALVYLSLKELGASPLLRGGIVFLLLANPALHIHALSGMETLAFSAVVAACLWALLKCLGAETPCPGWEAALSLLLLAAGLLRPEGVALAGAFALALCWRRLGQGRDRALRGALIFACLYLVPALAYFAWRVGYYGRLLPNTYHAKVYHEGFFHPDTLRRFGQYVYLYAAFPAAAAALALVLGRSAERASGRAENSDAKGAARHAGLACAALGFVWALVTLKYVTSALAQNFSHRFFLHLHPCLLVALGWIAQRGAALPATRWILVAAFACQALLQAGQFPVEAGYSRMYGQFMDDVHLPSGSLVRKAIPEGEWLIAYKEAGLVPYLADRKTVDFGWLNDERLTMPDMTLERRVDYFFDRRAAGIVFSCLNWDRLSGPPAELDAIIADPRFAQYRFAAKFRTTRASAKLNYYDFVYLRSDIYERWAASGAVTPP